MPHKASQDIDSNKLFLVNFSELEGRLDPAFYNPTYYKLLDSKKVNWVRLNAVTENLKHPSEYKRNFVVEGYQLIRSQNVRPTGIDLSENPVFLAKDVVLSTSAIFPQINDILIVRSGVNAGDVAVVEDELKDVTIGADTLLLNVNQEVLPKFVQVYFFTEIGRNQLNRYVTGATNKHLNSYSLKHVYFPKIDILVQKKCVAIIEDAFWQKHQRKEQAESLLGSIDTYLLNELWVTLPEVHNDLKDRMFFLNRSDLEGRFDPTIYKDGIRLVSSKWDNVKLSNVAHINPEGSYRGTPTSTPISFIPMEVIDESFSEIVEMGGTTIEQSSGFTKFKEGDLLWAKITPCMQNGKSAVAKNLINGLGCGSTEFFVLRPKDERLAIEYLHVIFHMKCVRETAKLYFGGSAGQQRVSSSFLEKFNLPLPPKDKQIEIALRVYEMRQQAKVLQEEGSTILENAKKEVEEIIMG